MLAALSISQLSAHSECYVGCLGRPSPSHSNPARAPYHHRDHVLSLPVRPAQKTEEGGKERDERRGEAISPFALAGGHRGSLTCRPPTATVGSAYVHRSEWWPVISVGVCMKRSDRERASSDFDICSDLSRWREINAVRQIGNRLVAHNNEGTW